jgi:hypothetical protein
LKYLESSKTYGEYGVGKSTEYVAKNSQARIISVDSDIKWIDKTRSEIGQIKSKLKSIDLHHVNLGPVGEWGRPLSYDNINNAHEYANYIWSQKIVPDFVLIDGRFRVYCFLTCVKRAPQNTVIFFDDYVERKYYHVVEKFVKPHELNARQAIFKVDKIENRELIQSYIDHFKFVFD